MTLSGASFNEDRFRAKDVPIDQERWNPANEAFYEDVTFYGELSLDGSLRAPGYEGYGIARAAFNHCGPSAALLTDRVTALQASPINGEFPLPIYGFTSLAELLKVLKGEIRGTSYLIQNSLLWHSMINGGEAMTNAETLPL